jgi:predicted Ser/Thr protein kinase
VAAPLDDTNSQVSMTVTVDVGSSLIPAPFEPGVVVAGRYRVDHLIGRGGFGEVWEGEDLLSGALVAVKLLGRHGAAARDATPDHRQQELLHEILALRLLRLPGVVRLLDEGVDQGRAFIVMERVEGKPFPGAGRAQSWPAVIEVGCALLESLARIHAAGVIHRDLKPANVLVTPDGQPIVLDFGISRSGRLGSGQGEEMLVGTPAYLAPEQLTGEPATPRTDLYAVGVLLYEALSGRLPHDHPDVRRLLEQRAKTAHAPLRTVAPWVPESIARVVDRLLARAPEERPRSAAEVLALLRGDAAARGEAAFLPCLGGDAPIQAAIAALREGRSVDLVGPPEAGRSRLLREIGEALRREGIRAALTAPGAHAFESLEAALGPLALPPELGIAEASTRVEAQLAEALSAGLVLLADDEEELDRWSAAIIERQREKGRVARVRPARSNAHAEAAERPVEVAVAALEEAELTALFEGPDRIFHLRTDAARVLWMRTGGLAGRVAEEIEGWLRAGVARWDGPLLAVDRDTLDQLASGLCVLPLPRGGPLSSPSALVALSPHLERLLGWIALAYPDADPALLARALGAPRFRVEADIDELLRLRRARRQPDGTVEPRWASEDRTLSPSERRAAHRAIAEALPAGAARRFRHLGAAIPDGSATEEDTRALGREVEALGRRLAEEGRLGQAIAALGEGLSALRRAAPPVSAARTEAEERLLSAWVEVALAEWTPQAQTRVLVEIDRAEPRTPLLRQLEALLRAALAFWAGGERALSLANGVQSFADKSLEMCRQGLRVLAARRGTVAIEEQVLGEVTAWAERAGGSAARTRLSAWMGRLHYRKGEFEEASRRHSSAAAGERWTTHRIAAWLNAASAIMEAFQHDEAARWAQAALVQARECRHCFYEARASWLLRTADYRRGATTHADLELVDAVSRIGNRDFEALVCVTEAGAAYRANDAATAIDLAMRAVQLWRSVHDVWPALLARCLAIAAGAPRGSSDEVEALGARATSCTIPGLGLQCLGLLARAIPATPQSWREAAIPLTAGVDPRHFGVRMDVLSVEEALASLGVGFPADARGAKKGRRARRRA